MANSLWERRLGRNCPGVLAGAVGESVYSVFQTLAWLEAWQLRSGDLQGGAGLRVAAFTGGALLDGQGAGPVRGVAGGGFGGVGNVVGDGIPRTRGGGFGQVGGGGNRLDQFSFVHG